MRQLLIRSQEWAPAFAEVNYRQIRSAEALGGARKLHSSAQGRASRRDVVSRLRNAVNFASE
jgi:hypothetical protein